MRESEFPKFPHCELTSHSVEKWKFQSHQKNSRQINSLVIYLNSKNVTFTNFLPKICETKSQQFPNCASRNFCQKNANLTIIWRKFREMNLYLVLFFNDYTKIMHFVWKYGYETKEKITIQYVWFDEIFSTYFIFLHCLHKKGRFFFFFQDLGYFSSSLCQLRKIKSTFTS